MLAETMEYFGLSREFRKVGFFETEHHSQLLKEIKNAIKSGRLIAISGIVGCGKTTLLKRVQDELRQEKEVIVSKSLSIDKGRVKLPTLIMALFYDLATEKDFRIPVQPEKRERKLQELIRKRQKPVALFIDEAHDLHGKTLIGLKRLIEMVQDGGGTLSVVLAGHPKLKNDLRRATMEEIGSRTSVFLLEGIKDNKAPYIGWLLNQCIKPKTKTGDIFTTEAIELVAERLSTSLQIEHYLALAFEEAFKIGQKPVTPEIVASVLASDIDEIEPRLTRQGYDVKALADLLNVRPAEVKSYLRGQLAPGRTQQLKQDMLAAGIPI